jgi:hypothetical protein
MVFLCLFITIWFLFFVNGPLKMDTEELKIAGGAIAVALAVLSWTYQTGSKRLGVIDLFASEISAICRMSLIADFAFAQVCTAEREREGRAQDRLGSGIGQAPARDHDGDGGQVPDEDVPHQPTSPPIPMPSPWSVRCSRPRPK